MTNQIKNWIKWPLLAAMSWLALTGTALATISAYINNANVNYTIPPQVMPTIDATNFINNNDFSINFDAFTINVETFEPWNTVNYTNNGLMVANSAVSTDGIFFSLAPGCGFQFDTQTTNLIPRQMAGTFYNPGTIRANSLLDLQSNFFFLATIGKCIVDATNIINPGTIELGIDSLIQLNGQNIDLTRGTLNLESLNSFLLSGFLFENVGLNSLDYGVGTDTNADWDPSIDLQPTFAISSLFNSQLFFFNQMVVDPSIPYYSTAGSVGTNYNLVRAVFLNVNPGQNVTASVYFGGNPTVYLGPGFTTVGWAGSYIDPATGQPATNYLYINDFYIRGANTNNPVINGVPSNFTFTELNQPALFTVNPATPAYPAIVPGVVTNNYSYVDAQLVATTQATNASPINPSGALSNLTASIRINAANSLDLSLAHITGDNYLSLTSTNQFNGAQGAQIFSPFTDVNLGVTNGTMVFSNILEPSLPNWGGTCQAWSSDWISITTNSSINTDGTTNIYSVTNEYRVLLINANLQPTTPTVVQQLLLHATNDLVIGDALDVIGRFSTDAQNLTLTVNGDGATSPDGELNLQNSTNFWQTSTLNLVNLTNNGAIRLNNFQQFGSSAPISITNTTITPGTIGGTAIGTLSSLSIANVALNDSVTIGTNKYIFVYSLSKRGAPNQVKIGSSIYYSMLNLAAAINRGPGAGTVYSAQTVTNRQVYTTAVGTASLTNMFTVIAVAPGAAADSVVTTTTSKRLTWNGKNTLVGGADNTLASTNSTVITTGGRYNALINTGILTDQGASIWADNFVNSGTVSNDIGSFTLFSLTTTMTNEATNVVFQSGGDVAITADTLVISNTLLEAGRSLTLIATNLLTDGGTSSSNIWVVGANSVGYGISVPIKPPVGDLLGTAITNYAPANQNVINVWSGNDVGSSASGFTNNLAVGKLVLDAMGSPPGTLFTFRGSGNANALYVDDLQLLDGATNQDIGNNFIALNIETNIVIYYAQAEMEGLSIAQKMDGKNGNRLRWIQGYTNVFNLSLVKTLDNKTGLAASTTVDSNGNGIPNADDPTPFFTSSQVNLHTGTVTNNAIPVIWNSIPSSTNYLYRSTTGASGPFNQLVTNFVSPPQVPPVGGWPITNIVYDPIVAPMQFYNVIVVPNSTQFYGP